MANQTVASTAALAAVNSIALPDGYTVLVSATGATYGLHRESSLAPTNGTNVPGASDPIVKAFGIGNWILLPSGAAGTAAPFVSSSENIVPVAVSVVDPRFGADPTGMTDSSNAFANASNALAGTGVSLFVPSGTYAVATAPALDTRVSFIVGSGVSFTGAGASQLQLIAQGAQPSWFATDWYISNVGNDANAGTSAASPVKTIMGGIVAKWGTRSPRLPQTTTIHVQDSQTLGIENAVLEPVMIGPTNFFIDGTPGLSPIVTLTPATLTAKNQATGQLLQITVTSSQAALLSAGMHVVNNTKGSKAVVGAIVGTTVTLSQPITLALSSVFRSSVPTMDDTWAQTDSLTFFSRPVLNLTNFAIDSFVGTPSGNLNTGMAVLCAIWIPDTSGTAGRSNFAPRARSGWLGILDCQIDPQMSIFAEPLTAQSGYNARTYNVFVNKFWSISGCKLYAGYFGSSGFASHYCGFGSGAVLTSAVVFKNAECLVNEAYFGSNIQLFSGSVVRQQNGGAGTGGQVAYGPGAANLYANSIWANETGSTWATVWLLSGSHSFGAGTGSTTTGTSYSAGTFTDGRTLTAANFDSFGSVMDVKTGAAFCGVG